VNTSLFYIKKYQFSLNQRISNDFKWLYMTKQAFSPLSKSVCRQLHVGSNPTVSATKPLETLVFQGFSFYNIISPELSLRAVAVFSRLILVHGSPDFAVGAVEDDGI